MNKGDQLLDSHIEAVINDISNLNLDIGKTDSLI